MEADIAERPKIAHSPRFQAENSTESSAKVWNLMEATQADVLRQLLSGETRSLVAAVDGRWSFQSPAPGGIVSGSFNPLHGGHEGMARAAAKRLNQDVAFELPLVNADKPSLEPDEVERRLAQFAGRHTVWLTRTPLFHQKASLFPGSVFVVGYDTAERLLEPRYYGGPAGRDEALAVTRDHGCRFLVAARLHRDRLHTVADLRIEPPWDDLFMELPAEDFRLDVSSTQLRAARM
jgi:hypothetical protein